MTRAAAAAAAALALAGCGGSGEPSIKVAAASSLTEALTACLPQLDGVKAEAEFGGSDDLATQIRQGVGIDVFAAANTKLPEALAREGKAKRPVVFATNELVVAVPRDSRITAFSDLVKAPAPRLAVGAASVPVGDYTQQVLDRLPGALASEIWAEVRTEEPDVKSIVGKLVTHAVDAGFVYRTDVYAAGDELRMIRLPADVAPVVLYGIAIVRDSAGARKVVDDILHGACADALRKAGFGAPPEA